MRFLGIIFILLVTISGCKKPSEQAVENSLAAVSGDSSFTFDQFRNLELNDKKVYVLKFGTQSCLPCKVLNKELPPIVKNIDSSKFVLVSVDLDKDESAEKVLLFLVNRDPKMKADYLAKKGEFEFGVTVPWVVAVDSNFGPHAFLHGFNSGQLETERSRYKSALSKITLK